jgi:hypothetical protein
VTIISDSAWNEIAKSAGGLPPEARGEIEPIVCNHRLGKGTELVHVDLRTREAMKRARTNLDELSKELTLLENSPDYRRFNSAGDMVETSLAEHLAALRAIDTTLHQAKERLAKRSRKNWSHSFSGRLITELLEIRAWHLKIDVPTQAGETTSSGSFRQYLKLCLQLACPDASEAEIENEIKGGIELAIESFQRRRKSPEHCWEWEDLFPQSARNLFYPYAERKKRLSRRLLER